MLQLLPQLLQTMQTEDCRFTFISTYPDQHSTSTGYCVMFQSMRHIVTVQHDRLYTRATALRKIHRHMSLQLKSGIYMGLSEQPRPSRWKARTETAGRPQGWLNNFRQFRCDLCKVGSRLTRSSERPVAWQMAASFLDYSAEPLKLPCSRVPGKR